MSLSLRQLISTNGLKVQNIAKMSTQSNNSMFSSWYENYYNSSSDGSEVAKTKNILEDTSIFPEFKSGPLKLYREKSSFCYKRMNVILEGEEHIRLKVSFI